MSSAFFSLLDDIALLMDDVAAVTKAATEKTSGLLADDLAVNAEKSSGFLKDREIPALWRITKGSFLNKIIILPVVFILMAFLPSFIIIILLLGGIYLAYEGVHKIVEYVVFIPPKMNAEQIVTQTDKQIREMEDKRVKSAIFVDFILSIEIIIIAISTVTDSEILVQILVVSIVAILSTVGVYGLVALIVRMDDMGYTLMKKGANSFSIAIGKALVKGLPIIIKLLGLVGTVALVLVAGGIFNHQIDFIYHRIDDLPSVLADAFTGLLVGFIAYLLVLAYEKVKSLSII